MCTYENPGSTGGWEGRRLAMKAPSPCEPNRLILGGRSGEDPRSNGGVPRIGAVLPRGRGARRRGRRGDVDDHDGDVVAPARGEGGIHQLVRGLRRRAAGGEEPA